MSKRKRNGASQIPTYDIVQCFKNECFPDDMDRQKPIHLQLKNGDEVPSGELFISIENIESGCLYALHILEKITFPPSGKFVFDERWIQILNTLLTAYSQLPERGYHLETITFLRDSKDMPTLSAMIYVMIVSTTRVRAWTPSLDWCNGFGASPQANDFLTRLVESGKMIINMENGASIYKRIVTISAHSQPLTLQQLSFISLFSAAMYKRNSGCTIMHDDETSNILPLMGATRGQVVWRYRGYCNDIIPSEYILKILQCCVLFGVYVWVSDDPTWKDLDSGSKIWEWDRIAQNKLIKNISESTNYTLDVARLVVLYCRESTFGLLYM